MPEIINALPAQKSHLYNIYQDHHKIIKSSDIDELSLHSKLQRVTNTAEEKRARSVSCSPQPKTGWLKYLLAGMAIMTGCQRCFQFTSNRPESAYSSHSYSHKPDAGKEIHNRARSPVPEVTARDCDSQVFTCHSTTTLPTEQRHEDNRHIYYQTLPRDSYYPLGINVYKALDVFCQQEVKDIVFKAFNADLSSRCTLLAGIIEKFPQYKACQSTLMEINSNKKQLSPAEHAEEIMAQRKLIILYLAAESIINQNSASYFHMIAMGDNKKYSAESLIKKEGEIMHYYSRNKAVAEY